MNAKSGEHKGTAASAAKVNILWFRLGIPPCHDQERAAGPLINFVIFNCTLTLLRTVPLSRSHSQSMEYSNNCFARTQKKKSVEWRRGNYWSVWHSWWCESTKEKTQKDDEVFSSPFMDSSKRHEMCPNKTIGLEVPIDILIWRNGEATRRDGTLSYVRNWKDHKSTKKLRTKSETKLLFFHSLAAPTRRVVNELKTNSNSGIGLKSQGTSPSCGAQSCNPSSSIFVFDPLGLWFTEEVEVKYQFT